MKKYKFIDLFAGIGGMRMGFEKNKMECVFSSEWDIHAKKTYAENFGVIPHGDIHDISANDIPDFDILLGGFPCQPFSMIGKRKGFSDEKQGDLFFEILRILDAKKPRAFLLENVPGIITIEGGSTLKQIISMLDELGYNTSYYLIDASDYGVPQVRKRVYIIGFLKDCYTTEFTLKTSTKKKVDIGEYLESNPQGYSISKHLQESYLFKKNDGKPEIINSNSKGQVKTLVSTYHKIQRLTGTFVQDGPTGLRLLSERECKALMGFPSNYVFPVSRTQMYRQLGNSVVVPVIEDIAKQMKKYMNSEKRNNNDKKESNWNRIRNINEK